MTAMLRITAPHFVAGVEVRDNKIFRAAPILKFSINWTFDQLQEFCEKKKWKIEDLNFGISGYQGCP